LLALPSAQFFAIAPDVLYQTITQFASTPSTNLYIPVVAVEAVTTVRKKLQAAFGANDNPIIRSLLPPQGPAR
jgi:hypothetical protein